MKLPSRAQLVETTQRRFEETIIFVPFFAGRRENLRRHAEFVRDLGYASILFENKMKTRFGTPFIPISKRGIWGLKHVWADEYEELLDAVDGPKIIFGFSGPSACAIEAVSKRQTKDVRAIICDSGPFYYSRHCNSNRLFYDEGIDNPFKRLALANIHQLVWSHNHEASLGESLARLPNHFPIMSIRPVQDRLVPPWAIDAAFRAQKHLDLEILSMKDAAHLKGLKDFPEIYKPAVEKFLKKHSTPFKVQPL